MIRKINKEIVKNSFSKAANSYDKNAGFQREIGDKIIQILTPRTTSDMKIIDIGSGTGYLSHDIAKRYPNSFVCAIDISHKMSIITYNKNNQHINPRVITADAEQIPINNFTFDLVISNLSLQWTSDIKTAFSEIFRILKKDSFFLSLYWVAILSLNLNCHIINILNQMEKKQ